MNKITVKGTTIVEVEVNPLHVIEELKLKVLGAHWRWVQEKDGKFYVMYESHKMDIIDREITKKEYEYFNHLNEVYKYLNNVELAKYL